MPTPRLIIAASEQCPDMLYATGFFAPDPFLFLEKNGKRMIVLNDLEIDRGRAQARVDEVISYSDIAKRLPKSALASFADIVIRFLKEQKVRKAWVPASFPLGMASELAKAGIALIPQSGLFWKEREFKADAELKLMRRALAITEAGLARAMEVLRATEIKQGKRLQWAGRSLTSEILRAEIDSAVLHAGGQPANTIVAGGNQACDPHERGSGPLHAHSLIILDIFPRDARTGYFGDMTRTVVRGHASEDQRRIWETVKQAQTLAIKSMKPGADGGEIHDAVKDFFTLNGYPTGMRDGRQTGFFHGTGHGLGLEIHEEPRFAKTVFKHGQVITVEPGLYYPGLGGVRIEDVVTVTDTGVRMLSKFQKQLEL
ncbi:MAG: Xaa-Pro peptidase family protein [Verrucomicrobiota bacterium]